MAARCSGKFRWPKSNSFSKAVIGNAPGCRQLRSILKKYRDVSGGKEELQKELKEKFGIDLVFFGRKDAPYGYMIVDHAHRTVINGARVLATEQLLDLATPEQRFARIEDYIDRLLTLNPENHAGRDFPEAE